MPSFATPVAMTRHSQASLTQGIQIPRATIISFRSRKLRERFTHYPRCDRLGTHDHEQRIAVTRARPVGSSTARLTPTGANQLLRTQPFKANMLIANFCLPIFGVRNLLEILVNGLHHD